MKVTPFDPDRKLILIQATIWGPLGQRVCRMALDCAATMTLVVPDVLDGLGYNPRDGIEITEVVTPLDLQKGCRVIQHGRRASSLPEGPERHA